MSDLNKNAKKTSALDWDSFMGEDTQIKTETKVDTDVWNDLSVDLGDIEKLKEKNALKESQKQKQLEIAKLKAFEYREYGENNYIVTKFIDPIYTRVEVPNSVLSIAKDAFAGSNVTSVMLNEGLIRIEANAFAKCPYLRVINIPSTVEFIGDNAFKDCPNLEIIIPKTVCILGKDIISGTLTEKKQIAEAKLKAEKQRKLDNDIAKANEVDLLIRSIPLEITINDEHYINSASKAYFSLTDDQKQYVKYFPELEKAGKNYAIVVKNEEERLRIIKEQEEERIRLINQNKIIEENKSKAAEVDNLISKISTKVTLKDKAAIDKALKAFKGLTTVQKNYVKNSSKLELAINDYENAVAIEEARKKRERLEQIRLEEERKEQARLAEIARQQKLEQERLAKIEAKRQEELRIQKLNKQADDLYNRACNGDINAQIMVGDLYLNGNEVVKKSPVDAFEWYYRAANSGSIVAMERVGDCYYNGYGVEQSFSNAKKWYKKASK